MSNSETTRMGTTSEPSTQLVRSSSSLDTVSHQVDRNDNRQTENNNISNDPGDAQVNSVINITNSNDIVIGPMMQYQGEVTIFQYMDSNSAQLYRPKALEIESNVFFFIISKTCLNWINQHLDTPTETDIADLKRKSRKFWTIVSIVIVLSGVFGLSGPYMTFVGVDDLASRVEETRGPPEIRFSDGYAQNTSKDLIVIFCIKILI